MRHRLFACALMLVTAAPAACLAQDATLPKTACANGVSIIFLESSDPMTWNDLRGIGLGLGAALLGVALARYISHRRRARRVADA